MSLADRRSRRGTWSLIAVGFSILLLVLVTIAVGVQSFAVTRGFAAGREAMEVNHKLLELRRLQVALDMVEQARLQAVASGRDDDLQTFRSNLARLVVIAGQTTVSLPSVTASLALQADARTGTPGTIVPVTDQLAQSLDVQFSKLSARLGEVDANWATWQKRGFHLIFLTTNLTMLLLITGGGLLLLYAGWHIDSRQKLQEARQAVLKAERDRASFVAAAGHDLRQPLQAISLFVTSLNQRVVDEDTKALVGKIAQSSYAMRRMINGLLDVAKLDAGLVSADQIDLPLNETFLALTAEFDSQAQAKGLTLVIEPTDAVVHTDPLLLESILRNLLANAINYTSHGQVGMSARTSGRRVLITVRDTGPGIAADEVDLVFRDFYRVSGSAGGGLGLGLGIVQRLSKLIYAQIAVDSTVGLGTRFTVAVSAGVIGSAMPIQQAPALALPPPNHAPPRQPAAGDAKPAGTILLVDDDETLRGALAAQLAAWGMPVTAAGTLDAACQAVRKLPQPLDLAIVDYDLGHGQTGLDLLQRLSTQEGRRVSGMVITGSSDTDVHRALKNSGYPFLQKPFEPETLRDTIQRMLVPVR